MSGRNFGSGDISSRGQAVELRSTGRAKAPVPTRAVPESTIEPERYELAAGAPYRFDLDRREFFKFVGAGLVVFSVLKTTAAAQ